ncbi:MAG: hypothetical protein ACLVL7_02605 [Anaerotruncus massiliensis (ex Togo et al. 2019)]
MGCRCAWGTRSGTFGGDAADGGDHEGLLGGPLLAFDELTPVFRHKEAQVLFTLIDRLRKKGLIVITFPPHERDLPARKQDRRARGGVHREHRAADTDETAW